MDEETSFPRLGHAFVVNPTSEAALPAQLHVSPELGVRLDIPYTAESDSTVGRWFTREADACPEMLVFEDGQLDLHLLGCRVSGFTDDSRYGPGIGHVRADFAIEDGDRSQVDYRMVERVQSQVDGLHEFMGWTIADLDLGALSGKETLLKAANVEPVVLAPVDGFEVTLVPDHWAGRDRPNVMAIGEITWLQTNSPEPRPLREHLVVHKKIRDLLALICWQPFDFQRVYVRRSDAPALALSGAAAGATSRRLHAPDVMRRHHSAGPPAVHFAIIREPVTFTEVGLSGIDRWLNISEELQRFVDPLLALLFAPLITPEVALMQASISAEALGYMRARRQGLTPKKAAWKSFADRLADILSTQPLTLADLSTDDATWVTATADAYNGLKHANLSLPSRPTPRLLALTLIMLLRSHLLLELDVDPATVAQLKTHQSWWGLKSAYESGV